MTAELDFGVLDRLTWAYARAESHALSAVESATLVALAFHGGTGAFPSQGTLVARTRHSRSSVKRAIKALESKHLIMVQRGAGRGKANRYYLALDGAKGEPLSDAKRVQGEPFSDAKRVQGEPLSDAKRVQGEPLTVVKSKSTDTRARARGGFDIQDWEPDAAETGRMTPAEVRRCLAALRAWARESMRSPSPRNALRAWRRFRGNPDNWRRGSPPCHDCGRTQWRTLDYWRRCERCQDAAAAAG